MKTHKKVNDFTDTKLEVPRIPRGEVVRFELPNIARGRDGRIRMPMLVEIPARDTIVCPETGKIVEIAIIESMSEKSFTTSSVVLGRETGGQLVLRSGNVKHEEIFAYLELSNFNGSNENRDPSRPVIVQKVIPGAREKARRDRRRAVREAQNLIDELDLGSARGLLASFGVSAAAMPADVVFDALESRCETSPEVIVKALAEAESAGDISTIADAALSDGTVVFDAATGYLVVAETQAKLRKVSSKTRRAQLKALIDYLSTKDGAALADALRK